MACTKPEISKIRNNLSNSSGTCRVCMKKNSSLKALFGPECKIVERIQFCTGILLTENPILPSCICPECYSQLNIAYYFKTTCIESENTFRQLDVNETVTESDEDEPAEEIEYLDEDEAEINDLQEVGLINKNIPDPTTKSSRKDKVVPNLDDEAEINDLQKDGLINKNIPDPTTKSSRKDKVVPNLDDEAEINDLQEDGLINKNIPDPTTKSSRKGKVVPNLDDEAEINDLQEDGLINKNIPDPTTKVSETDKAIPMTNSQTVKLKVVHVSSKEFELLCKEKEKQKKILKEKKIPIKRVNYRYTNVRCKRCDIQFETKEESIKHHQDKHNMSQYVCEVCGKLFLVQQVYNRHMLKHKGNSFKCAHCSYSTVSKRDLMDHLTIHTGEKKYQCSECPLRFRTSSNCRKHVRYKHLGPFSCDRCDERFVNQKSLDKHSVKHTQTKRFACNLCDSCFFQRDQWKRHLLVRHAVSVPPAKLGRPRINVDTPSSFDKEVAKLKVIYR